MNTKCQLCRHWQPYIKHDFRGYGLCAARPSRLDGTPPMLLMAAWNTDCVVGKFVPIVPVAVKEQAA